VFGAPGSGKSFVMVQMAASVPGLKYKEIEFNLSQFGSLKDLHDALHQVRDEALSGVMPLVCWDEFDAAFQGEKLGWLRYFLAPMEDGKFREGQLSHPIGRAIFVFAGGTKHRMQDFIALMGDDAFCDLKGPDFISWLKGYVNVLGVNPRKDERDPEHVIRRAMWLRSILERDAPGLFDSDGALRIDGGVLGAFLEVEQYGHGGRSLESIVATSRLAGETSYQRSSLPPESQLDLHVNGREFLALVQRIDLKGEQLERLAQAVHEIYCEDLRERGYTWAQVTDEERKTNSSLVEWNELPEHLKRQNRAAARDIPRKLELIGHVMIPARSHDAPFDFPGKGLEQLAKDEHNRYMEAKLAEGWSPGPEKDDKKKTNPTLVDWEQLPDEEREKDRVQVRGIPRVLARAGYTVVRSSRENDK
jgi:RyR domain-containing protein